MKIIHFVYSFCPVAIGWLAGFVLFPAWTAYVQGDTRQVILLVATSLIACLVSYAIQYDLFKQALRQQTRIENYNIL